MKALVGAFNQEKALVGAFSVIVQPVVEPMDPTIGVMTELLHFYSTATGVILKLEWDNLLFDVARFRLYPDRGEAVPYTATDTRL